MLSQACDNCPPITQPTHGSNTSPMTDMPPRELKRCVRGANIVYGAQTLHVEIIQCALSQAFDDSSPPCQEPKHCMQGTNVAYGGVQGANVVCVAHLSMKRCSHNDDNATRLHRQRHSRNNDNATQPQQQQHHAAATMTM
ncbi:hypothetical protein BU15DRAFT_68252 [Melanogaster broomeanus]|nr:hypothetical protein BU15DRAFT_68252 [Melanogaster broomeanus]